MIHLLRNVPPYLDGKPVTLEEFYRLIATYQEKRYLFGSFTKRRPRRIDELEGGSVYFVHRSKTVFRMPLYGFEVITPETFPRATEKWHGHLAICCWSEIIKVETLLVRYLRGWRYLHADQVPADIVEGEVPEDIRREAEEAFDKAIIGGNDG